jgi:hypothetical protein
MFCAGLLSQVSVVGAAFDRSRQPRRESCGGSEKRRDFRIDIPPLFAMLHCINRLRQTMGSGVI